MRQKGGGPWRKSKRGGRRGRGRALVVLCPPPTFALLSHAGEAARGGERARAPALGVLGQGSLSPAQKTAPSGEDGGFKKEPRARQIYALTRPARANVRLDFIPPVSSLAPPFHHRPLRDLEMRMGVFLTRRLSPAYSSTRVHGMDGRATLSRFSFLFACFRGEALANRGARRKKPSQVQPGGKEPGSGPPCAEPDDWPRLLASDP